MAIKFTKDEEKKPIEELPVEEQRAIVEQKKKSVFETILTICFILGWIGLIYSIIYLWTGLIVLIPLMILWIGFIVVAIFVTVGTFGAAWLSPKFQGFRDFMTRFSNFNQNLYNSTFKMTDFMYNTFLYFIIPFGVIIVGALTMSIINVIKNKKDKKAIVVLICSILLTALFILFTIIDARGYSAL